MQAEQQEICSAPAKYHFPPSQSWEANCMWDNASSCPTALLASSYAEGNEMLCTKTATRSKASISGQIAPTSKQLKSVPLFVSAFSPFKAFLSF